MKYFYSVLWLLMVSANALALDIDWKLYMRTPVGTNTEGGKEFSLQNPGSQGNEFRLGNETTYAEAYFTAHVLKGGEQQPFFDANLTFAYNPQMNSQYGDTTTNTDYTQVVQAFVKGGNFDGFLGAFWAGKRFYRDVDLHMDDFFYFANMSGVGGGVEDIPLGNGTLAVALLQHSDNTFQKATNGVPSKQAVDLRWRNLKIGEHESLQLWLAAAYTAPGTGNRLDPSATTPTYVLTDYEAGHGVAAGVRWQHNFNEQSFNNLALMYGTGVMENFTMDNSLAYVQTGAAIASANRRKRLRVVENPIFELGPKWSLALGLVYEDADNGASALSHSRWASVGARPIYYFTDHYHLAFEAGISDVKVDSETGAGGGSAGDRTLSRVSLAPEVAIGKGFFARPVIRAYVAHTWWNKANQDLANSGSLISSLNGQNITALNGRLDETQVGLEAEVWF